MTDKEVIVSLSSIDIFGLTLWGEARGEPIEGIVAIANVIRNRKKSSTKYKAYRDVCLEPRQFSCWNVEDPNYPLIIELGRQMIFNGYTTDKYLHQCLYIATGIMDDTILDNVDGKQFYMTTIKFQNNPPTWAKQAKGPVTEFGKQTFFNV